jgi:hypothetical protein
MQGFVHRVAIGLAILHIAGGCCWHHAHGRESSAVPAGERVAAPQQCGAACAPCCTRPGDGHQPPQPCAENSCDLVAGQRAPSGELASAWYLLARAPLGADAAISRQAARCIGPRLVGVCRPVRLHLLHQLLLI